MVALLIRLGLGCFISIYVEICGACGVKNDVFGIFLLGARKLGELAQKKKILGLDTSVGWFWPWEFGGTTKSRLKSSRLERDDQGKFRKKSSHPLTLSMKGVGRYQGVGAAEKAMVALGPNRLLGYGGVGGLWIPPQNSYRLSIIRNNLHFKKSKFHV